MIFYTTKEQEILFDFDYNKKIEEKKKEIKKKELETGEIQKWTAYAYVKRNPRIFHKIDNKYYLEIDGNLYKYEFEFEFDTNSNANIDNNYNLLKMINSTGGKIYKVDSQFDSLLNNFINKNNNWKIFFYPDKKDGSVSYISKNKHDTPAKIISLDDENKYLCLEDNEKYELVCG